MWTDAQKILFFRCCAKDAASLFYVQLAFNALLFARFIFWWTIISKKLTPDFFRVTYLLVERTNIGGMQLKLMCFMFFLTSKKGQCFNEQNWFHIQIFHLHNIVSIYFNLNSCAWTIRSFTWKQPHRTCCLNSTHNAKYCRLILAHFFFRSKQLSSV